MKKAISLALSIILSAAIMPFSGMPGAGPQFKAIQAAAAETETPKTREESYEPSETVKEIGEQLSDPENDPFDYTEESAKAAAVAAAESEYPDAVDLRNYEGTSYVTPVKFQNPYNNCWGFAAIAAAETSILGDDELRGDYTADVRLEPGKIQMDLSEKHLTYFARLPIGDPDNPQHGEGNSPYIINNIDPVAAIYDMGAFAPTATSMFAASSGPVLESEDPLFEYKGKKATVQEQWVDGKFQKFCYSPSPKDDWTLDESMRFDRSYALLESFQLPSPATLTETGGEEHEYSFNAAGVAAIKSQLLQKRGVQIGYYPDTFVPARGETHSTYINDNWAHYTFEPVGAAHAVCIVGYDDNYPAENFRHESDDPDEYTADDTVPPGDGAWLVKNSWGSGFEEFPNKGEGFWGIREVLRDENGDPVTDENGDPVMAGSGYFWLSYYDQSIATPEALDFEAVAASENVIDQHDYMAIDEYRAAHVANEVRVANIFTAGVCEELRAVSCETTYPGTEVTFEIYLLAEEFSDPTDGVLMDTVTAGPFEYGGFHKVQLSAPFMVMRGQSYAVVVTQKVPTDNGSSYAFSVKMSRSGNAVINEGESLVFTDGEWNDYSDPEFREALLGMNEDEDEEFDSWAAYDNFPIKGYAEERPDVIIEVGYDGYIQLPTEEVEDPEAYFMMWLTGNSGESHDVVPEWEIAEGGEDVITLADGRDPTRKTLRCNKLGGTYLLIKAEGIGMLVYPIVVEMPSPDVDKIVPGDASVTITTADDLTTGIAGYEIRYRPEGSSDWTVKVFEPASNTMKLTGLKNGGTYEIELHYWVETAGRKYYSYDTEEECAILPGASRKVTLTNVVSGIKISWEQVEGAKYYKVYRGNKFLVTTSRLFTTDLEVKNSNGTKYTYKVVASLTKDDDSGDSPKARTSTGYRLTPVGIKSLSNLAAGKMTVTYGKNAKCTGYVIRYGLKSDMSDAKVITVQGAGTISKTFSGLTKGRTYYVQVRPYILENGVRYYSGFSTIRTVKIEK